MDEDDPAAVAAQRLAEYMLDTPQVQGVLGRIQNGLGQFQGLLDKLGRAIEDGPQRRPSVSRRYYPRRPARPDPATLREVYARQILGFSTRAPLSPISKEEISKKRRELARKAHPDQGGSPEAMQKVNNAADLLTKLYTKSP
jgi:hypothetical protein